MAGFSIYPRTRENGKSIFTFSSKTKAMNLTLKINEQL
jgi:hypothetical protein